MPERQWSLKDLAGIYAVAIGLAGLVWNAAIQVNTNDNQNHRLERIETTQNADHDTLTTLKGKVG